MKAQISRCLSDVVLACFKIQGAVNLLEVPCLQSSGSPWRRKQEETAGRLVGSFPRLSTCLCLLAAPSLLESQGVGEGVHGPSVASVGAMVPICTSPGTH